MSMLLSAAFSKMNSELLPWRVDTYRIYDGTDENRIVGTVAARASSPKRRRLTIRTQSAMGRKEQEIQSGIPAHARQESGDPRAVTAFELWLLLAHRKIGQPGSQVVQNPTHRSIPTRKTGQAQWRHRPILPLLEDRSSAPLR